MYASNAAEKMNPTIQNRHALSADSAQAIRTAFFISDGTAITAETLGRSILSQFASVPFETRVLPYVDSLERAEEAVEQINIAYQRDGLLPLVFDTIVNPDIREKINSAQSCNLDMYEGLIGRIAEETGVEPDSHSGHAHDDVDSETYKERIDAVHLPWTMTMARALVTIMRQILFWLGYRVRVKRRHRYTWHYNLVFVPPTIR